VLKQPLLVTGTSFFHNYITISARLHKGSDGAVSGNTISTRLIIHRLFILFKLVTVKGENPRRHAVYKVDLGKAER